MSNPPTMRWLDLSAHGARMAIFQMEDKTTNLILSGVATGTPEWEKVRELGFVPTESGRSMIRLGVDVNTRALRAVFPRARVADIEVSKVWLKVKGTTAAQEPEEAKDDGASKGPRTLGVNHEGHPVFEDDTGRFYRYQGSEIYEDRAFVAAGPTDVEQAARAAQHLRATSDAALHLCADGFVREMASGRSMRKADLARFAQTVHGEPQAIDSGDVRLRKAQEAIEAAMQRALTRAADSPTDEAFSYAVRMTDRQPTFGYRTSTSVGNQQYSTPLPMSIAAQRILGPRDGETLLEPTIGNASLVALMPKGVKVVGIEIDPARAEQTRYAAASRSGEVGESQSNSGSSDARAIARQALLGYFAWVRSQGTTEASQVTPGLHGGEVFQTGAPFFKPGVISVGGIGGHEFKIAELWKESLGYSPATDATAGNPAGRGGLEVIVGDFLGMGRQIGQDFDCVIANPPFGGLQQPVVFEDLRCTRIDHLIAVKALQRRKDDGRSVFIVGADRDSLVHPGKVAGGSKTFLAWLVDHYEVEDAVELNGALYKKQGAEYPVRMITVGRRRTEAEAAEALASKQFRLPDTLPVIHTWDNLWSHAKKLAKSHETRLQELETEDSVEKQTHQAEQGVLPLGEAEWQADPLLTQEDSAAVVGEQETPQAEPEQHVENEYQAPYIPASRINEPTAMIPRNLLGPVRKALARLTDELGEDVDSYVARKLEFTIEDLEVAFSAEQVDAIALAIKRIEEGRGFIVGDQTGQGKGRVLAGVGRYAVLSGKGVAFFTEKANLFSDFWRDLKDIGSDDLFRPFILNGDEPVRNMETNKVEVAASKPADLKRMMDGRMSILDAGHNLMFSTYSQFNREHTASKKSAWLADAVKGAVVILDESHVAAGESHTADNIARAVESSSAAIYSSATYAKNAKNMRAYSKVFPASVQVESLADTLAVGGEPLQEVLSAMLAEEGVFIRREHDLSKLEFNTVVASKNAALHESWADSLSAALREMSYLSGDVTRVAKQMNKDIRKKLEALPEEARKGNRMGVSYQGFGSRLYNILRQFMIAIKVDDAADAAVQALKEGRKPVLVMEQTFEAILKEALQSRDDLDGEMDAANIDLNGASLPRLSFRDVMHRVAAKLETIYVRDDYGNGHYENIRQQAKTREELEAIEDVIRSVKDKIDALPDLAVAPLDSIREKIQAYGHTVGEISGRTFETSTDPTDPSRIVVTVRPDERLRTIQEFNNGSTDAVQLTRAGATGLSLHSSEKFADQRQREMIELQIANNVAERVQFFGRVNRRGQVNHPRITTVVSPLPSEARVLAMQNAKLRKLSANTQSNRNNQAELRDVPDILNKIGDDICRRYLIENPDIAALLDISAMDESVSTDEAYFANKLTGRIALLPVVKQRAVYADLSRVYAETLQELEAKGINPFQTSVYDWGAKIVETKVFRAGKEDGSVFDRPTYLTTLEWEEEVIPISSEVMQEGVARSRQFLARLDGRFVLAENPYATGEADKWSLAANKMLSDIDAAFDKFQKRSLRSLDSFDTLEEALASTTDNPIKYSEARRTWLKERLTTLLPGKLVSFSGEEDERCEGMVLSLRVPEEPDDAHLLGQYQISIVVPGSSVPSKVSFNQLLGDPTFDPLHRLGSDYRNPFKEFDVAKPGRVVFRRFALTGNMFAAAQFAAQNRCGNAGIFVDEHGDRHRAVVMYARITADDLENQPVALSRTQATDLLERAASEGVGVVLIGDASLDPDKGAQVILQSKTPETFQIVSPGTKSAGGRVFTNAALIAITGDFAGDKRQMSVAVPIHKLERVMEVLTGQCGQALYVAAGKARRLMPQLEETDIQPVALSRPRMVA